jgi:hypothetical protein
MFTIAMTAIEVATIDLTAQISQVVVIACPIEQATMLGAVRKLGAGMEHVVADQAHAWL